MTPDTHCWRDWVILFNVLCREVPYAAQPVRTNTAAIFKGLEYDNLLSKSAGDFEAGS